MTRGVIYNRDEKRRIIDFSGMRWGNITPTDIDAFVEFKGKCFIAIECKGICVPVPFGQKLALERLLRHINMGGSKGIVIVCDVRPGGVDDDIDLANCESREVWCLGVDGSVIVVPTSRRVKDVCDSFIDSCNIL